jgi:hypothetical protein
MSSKRHEPQSGCMAAHDSINKLAAIIGQCDLLLGVIIPAGAIAERVQTIRQIAIGAIAQMNEHQQQLLAEEAKSDKQKAG